MLWGLGSAQLALLEGEHMWVGITGVAFKLAREEELVFPKQRSGGRTCMRESMKGRGFTTYLGERTINSSLNFKTTS